MPFDHQPPEVPSSVSMAQPMGAVPVDAVPLRTTAGRFSAPGSVALDAAPEAPAFVPKAEASRVLAGQLDRAIAALTSSGWAPSDEGPPPPVAAIRASPGAGKSRVARERLARSAPAGGRRRLARADLGLGRGGRGARPLPRRRGPRPARPLGDRPRDGRADVRQARARRARRAARARGGRDALPSGARRRHHRHLRPVRELPLPAPARRAARRGRPALPDHEPPDAAGPDAKAGRAARDRRDLLGGAGAHDRHPPRRLRRAACPLRPPPPRPEAELGRRGPRRPRAGRGGGRAAPRGGRRPR